MSKFLRHLASISTGWFLTEKKRRKCHLPFGTAFPRFQMAAWYLKRSLISTRWQISTAKPVAAAWVSFYGSKVYLRKTSAYTIIWGIYLLSIWIIPTTFALKLKNSIFLSIIFFRSPCPLFMNLSFMRWKYPWKVRILHSEALCRSILTEFHHFPFLFPF